MSILRSLPDLCGSNRLRARQRFNLQSKLAEARLCSLFCVLVAALGSRVASFRPTSHDRHYAVAPLFSVPPGRIPDIDDWVRLSNESLKRFTGKSLYERMGLDDERPQLVHENARYGVLSHGTQPDPIYHYFNQAALEAFGYPESEIYQIPSRMSAPEHLRLERDQIIQSVLEEDVRLIPVGIRQRKTGEIFQINDIVLWNVYDDLGQRVGQTALYDRAQIRPVDE